MNLVGVPNVLIMSATLASMFACTWVPLTNEGQGVRILKESEVVDCEKIGKTRATTADRVVIFARTDRKVREELDALARNEAADMGGNTIVRIGTVSDGRQSFAVYRCDSQ